LAEDEVRSDPTAEWLDVDERQREIVELFVEQQERFSRAVASDAYRAQQHATWTRVRRDPPEETIGEYLEKRERQSARRRREEARSEANQKRRADRRTQQIAEFEAEVRAFQEHQARTIRALTPIRGGNGRTGRPNLRTQALIPKIVELRELGLSTREMARETGLSVHTVRIYAPWVSRSAAMARKHARWKASGTPVVPPWQRKQVQEAQPPSPPDPMITIAMSDKNAKLLKRAYELEVKHNGSKETFDEWLRGCLMGGVEVAMDDFCGRGWISESEVRKFDLFADGSDLKRTA
jgi:hypothetical protein